MPHFPLPVRVVFHGGASMNLSDMKKVIWSYYYGVITGGSLVPEEDMDENIIRAVGEAMGITSMRDMPMPGIYLTMTQRARVFKARDEVLAKMLWFAGERD